MRFRVAAAAASAAVAICLAAPAAAATYSGTLPLPGVVWISDDSKPAPLPESTMTNSHKSFVPDLLVITAGSVIRFPNEDAFFHSIYSQGPPNPFDIGFYDTGPGKTVTFANAGVVAVRCHIHGIMHGTIVIVDGPWAQTHVANAKFELNNVRPGSHTLHMWQPESGETTSVVRLKD